MSESTEPHGSRVEVGRYLRLAAARERGLVVSAKELPHWIEREDDEWVLLVEEDAREIVLRELSAFEAEEQERPADRGVLLAEKAPTLSLYVAAWVLSAFFFVQQAGSPRWEERGAAASDAILRGEWWRTVTALFLHADGPHVTANLATGLLFALFVIPRLGTGLTWLAILVSGALGNAINAWGYRGEAHVSIGASTACFGALGILVGAELLARWREPETRGLWPLILPIGAGMALLAYLGVGEEGKNVDYMAHCWGFLVGLAEGALALGLRLKERGTAAVQRIAAGAAVAAIGAAWVLAMR
jgi:membrane associated rhomboid family serine protease